MSAGVSVANSIMRNEMAIHLAMAENEKAMCRRKWLAKNKSWQYSWLNRLA